MNLNNLNKKSVPESEIEMEFSKTNPEDWCPKCNKPLYDNHSFATAYKEGTKLTIEIVCNHCSNEIIIECEALQ